MRRLRTLRLVVALALLGVPGCGGSDQDPSPDAEYGTSLTIAKDIDRLYHGRVRSQAKVCAVGRRVRLLEQRRGTDRELGANRSGVAPGGVNYGGQFPKGDWAVYPARSVELQRGARIYAEAAREERAGYVCRAARSKVLLHEITVD